MLEWLLPLSFIMAFLVCLFLLPPYINKAYEAEMVGLDIHKANSPKVAESGGVVLMLAYLIGLFSFIPFVGEAVIEQEIVATAATVLFLSFIGFIDDVYETRWSIKILTPLIGGVPLAVMQLGRTTIPTPMGIFDFGRLGLLGLIFFHFIIIPFIVTASANVVNMLAGLNGLEAGSIAIMALALASLCLVKGGKQIVGAIILVPFLGAITAFLIFNRYPSRVFPGDVGTFGMGAVIACCGMLANLERAVLVMFIPHITNALLFFIGKLKGREPPKEAPLNPDGTIPAPSIWSLRCLILRIHPMKEKALVNTMWLIVASFAIAGTLVYGF